MANLKLKNPAGGSLNLVSADGASDLTVTFPATTGTAMVSGNMPAFSAYRSGSTQLISNTTWTKVELNAENFDTANCFDSTTNYRFTPNVAGYYQVNGTINTNYSTLKRAMFAFYKNGSLYLVATDLDQASATASSFNEISGSTLVYMNGTTDYLELYVYFNGTTVSSTLGVYYGSSFTQFSGYLARAA
jgi:hypothetical protein